MHFLLTFSAFIHYIFGITLLLSVFEQIVWRGEENSLYMILVMLFFVEVALFAFINRKSLSVSALIILSAVLFYSFFYKDIFLISEHIYLVLISFVVFFLYRRVPRVSGLSHLFLFIVMALGLFSFFANLGQREYYEMAGEPVGEVVYADLWVFLLFVFAFLVTKKRKLLLPLIYASACVVVFIITLASKTDFFILGPYSLHLLAEPQYHLANCLMLAIYYVHTRTTSLPENLSFIKIIDKTVVPMCIALLLAVSMHFQNIIVLNKCVSERPEYRISEDFALYLFVAEDPLYYFHRGVEYHGLRMVIDRYVETGSRRYGGSSITMQLAKVCYLSYEKTFTRKLKQVLLAYLLELQFTKEDILSSYLERIPFSLDTYGLKNASSKYFNKTPEMLTKEEVLPLVLSITDPSEYNPQKSEMPDIVRKRKIVTNARVREFRETLSRKIEKLKIVS